MARKTQMAVDADVKIPQRVGDKAEVSYSEPHGIDFGPLARDKIPIRAMRETDLPAMITIDRHITGRDRKNYFGQKLEEALYESDVRVSLVAERDDHVVGFIMARVDLGAFGRMEPIAVMDTIGVDPGYRNQGIGRALLSQLLLNLASLRVERIRTEINWRDRELLAFLDSCGFRPSQELCFDRNIK